MVHFNGMERILYCTQTGGRKGKVFPFPVVRTGSLAKAYDARYPLVIFDEKFIRRRPRLDMSKFSSKVCFMYFPNAGKKDTKTLKQKGFFDFLNGTETAAQISLKMQRAQKVLDLQRRVHNLERELSSKNRRIENLVLVDPDTGCYNWRYFSNRAQQELSRARRHLYNISFLVIDIDYFRQVNEVYGVRVADAVIKQLVGLIGKNLRKEDLLCRWRDDEFFIVLPYLSKDEAYKVAKRIKERVFLHEFKCHKMTLNLKVSMGVVSFPEDKKTNLRDVMSALEECLLLAKRQGGAVIVSCSQTADDVAVLPAKEQTVDELKGKIQKLNTLLTRDLLEMIYGFARAIDAKDHRTGKHVEHTSLIAHDIATELKLPKREIQNITRAAALHDLGKVGIDQKILSKPGPLTNKEREVVKSHTWIATEILREIHALRGSIPSILYHHERYDGKGYPLGLKGDEIPLGARIVAISDVYQALTSDRPYRKGFTKKKALQIIREETGDHFDPRVASAFFKIMKRNKSL